VFVEPLGDASRYCFAALNPERSTFTEITLHIDN
jgi:hypothetical protein